MKKTIYAILGSVIIAGLWWKMTRAAVTINPFTGKLDIIGSTSTSAGTPGGADTNVQFNNSSAFGGSSSFTYINTSSGVYIGGPLTVGSSITVQGNPALIQGSTGFFVGTRSLGYPQLGLGTSAPINLLDIKGYGVNGDSILFRSTGIQATWSLGNNESAFGTLNAFPIVFQPNNADALRMNTDGTVDVFVTMDVEGNAFTVGVATLSVQAGNVGVGVSLPQSKFDLTGGSMTIRGGGIAIASDTYGIRWFDGTLSTTASTGSGTNLLPTTNTWTGGNTYQSWAVNNGSASFTASTTTFLGNVWVGTASASGTPAFFVNPVTRKASVAGTQGGTYSLDVYSTDSNTMLLRNDASSVNQYLWGQSQSVALLDSNRDGGSTQYSAIRFLQNGGASGHIVSDNADSNKLKIDAGSFGLNGAIVITSGHNVGIGSNGPSAKLHVSTGGIKVDGTNNFVDVSSGTVFFASSTINTLAYTWPQSQSANFLKNDGAGALTWAAAGSGGASTLAVATGTSSGFTGLVSSPTAVINFSSNTMLATLQGGATAFINVNPASVTVLGPNPPAASIAAGSLGGSVIASSITLAAMYGAPTLTGTNFSAVANSALDSSSITKQGPIVSSVTAASIYTIAASAVQAGSLGSGVIASSVTAASIYTIAASAVQAGSLGAAVIASSVTAASIYTIAASAVQAGSLGSGVIASSITLAAMYGAPTLTGTNFTSVPAASLTGQVALANGGTALSSGPVVDVPISAASLKGTITNGAGDASLLVTSTETGTNKINSDFLEFIDGTTKYAYFEYSLPDSFDASTVSFKYVWTSTGANSINTTTVTMCMQGLFTASGQNPDSQAYGTAQCTQSQFVSSGTDIMSIDSPAITIGNTWAANGFTRWRIYRWVDASGAFNDTMTASLRLEGIHLRYRKSRYTD